MHTFTKTLCLSFLLGCTTLFANGQTSVDQQIAAMQQATPQERVKLMNQFKQQLANMNADERAKSITQLREQMQQKNGQDHNHQAHSEAQRDQMQQNEKMQRMEQMQQRHAGDQYMHEVEKEMGDMGNDLHQFPQQP